MELAVVPQGMCAELCPVSFNSVGIWKNNV